MTLLNWLVIWCAWCCDKEEFAVLGKTGHFLIKRKVKNSTKSLSLHLTGFSIVAHCNSPCASDKRLMSVLTPIEGLVLLDISSTGSIKHMIWPLWRWQTRASSSYPPISQSVASFKHFLCTLSNMDVNYIEWLWEMFHVMCHTLKSRKHQSSFSLHLKHWPHIWILLPMERTPTSLWQPLPLAPPLLPLRDSAEIRVKMGKIREWHKWREMTESDREWDNGLTPRP